MPMSKYFKKRLSSILPEIVDTFGTPFHIYDQIGIEETCDKLNASFAPIAGFKEYFAVKALPNPFILYLLRKKGLGFDCSSIPELYLSRKIGAKRDEIMFTSNNTTRAQFQAAVDGDGAILNLDDISLIAKLPETPDLICFRYNPGPTREGNRIIGNPVEAKYGVSTDQIFKAYQTSLEMGVKKFGIHTMLASNELNYIYMVETAKMLLEIVEQINKNLGIEFEFINIGGGLGIPYRPDATQFDINSMAQDIIELFNHFELRNKWIPRLYMESGRYITGPHGALVTKVINHKNIYRNYVGIDASMSALMRPGMYEAYHHIHIHGKENEPKVKTVDVVGSLCENNDKFAIQRQLPETKEGDVLIIHDTGAHGHAMGFNYNGHLRPQELLLTKEMDVKRIRRAENLEDYFATLTFEPKVLIAS